MAHRDDRVVDRGGVAEPPTGGDDGAVGIVDLVVAALASVLQHGRRGAGIGEPLVEGVEHRLDDVGRARDGLAREPEDGQDPLVAGILAVGAATRRPVVEEDGSLAVATVMSVTLSTDHRVLDGALAAQWLAAFVARIENPLQILL
ncbi:2-oxo acid dehydrogenase subunit E2 [Microbacterium sp. NPDC016588]